MAKTNKERLSDTLTIYRQSDVGTNNYYVDIKLPRSAHEKGERTQYQRQCLHVSKVKEAKILAKEAELEIYFRQDHDIPIHKSSFEKAYLEWTQTALGFKSPECIQQHVASGNNYFFEYFNER